MQVRIDLDREYGIVLEGGGARGAYQVGAWKALREAGVKIKGIAGASVGALNGALMCMDELEKAEQIWGNLTYSDVMNIDNSLMEQFHELGQDVFRTKQLVKGLRELGENAVKIVREGGFDITPLRGLLRESVDEDRIRNSDRELYVTTFSVDEKKEIVLDVKRAPEGEMADALMASAYFPAFRNEKLGGKRYMDGGSLNNVPVNVLLERDYRDIIVIRIYGFGFDTEKVLTIPEGVSVSHIAPRQDLGGILEFNKKRISRNMQLGYLDAQRFLYGLAGRSYYLDAPRTEGYYFDKMMSELALVRHLIKSELEESELQKLEGYRTFTEQIFPALAAELKLKPDWDYKTLYLAVLEEWAKELKMPRMQIYTPDDIMAKVHERLRKLDIVLPI
ncbi:MAG: patatin-like phospholipase family protein [Lachnospiraceae bacterium]|nr:patatin-like phospholipase family protein [Lachnospiraceae bacterium]